MAYLNLARKALALSNLKAAYQRVSKNAGAPGVDGVGVAAFGVMLERNLRELQTAVLGGHYKAQSLRRAWLPREGRTPRQLGIPTVRDRVLQSAVAICLTPLFEAEFEDCSFAYRQGRSVRMAVERIGQLQRQGYRWVVDADIEAFFDHIPHEPMLREFSKLVSDPILNKLVAQWLSASVQEGDIETPTTIGVPQGSPISPMLANLYLDHLDEALLNKDLALVRYADDFVVLTKSEQQAQDALELTDQVLRDLHLKLNPIKTRIVSLDQGLEFLGWHFVRSLSVQRTNKSGNSSKQPTKLAPLPQLANEPIGVNPSPSSLSNAQKHSALVQHYLRENDELENPAIAQALEAALGKANQSEVQTIPATEQQPIEQITLPPPAQITAPIAQLNAESTFEIGTPTHISLQRTLYLIEQGAELAKEQEQLVVRKDDKTLLTLPALSIDLIVVHGNISLTTPAMQLCMRHQIPIALLSRLGKYYGRIDPANVSALVLQQAQATLQSDAAQSLALAQQFVKGKLNNSALLLTRYNRNRPSEKIAAAIATIKDAAGRTKTAQSLESLRGLEGSGAAAHFAGIRDLLHNSSSGDDWRFERRERPAADAINALLSFGYTLLYQTVAGLIQARGLNPHLGFFHVGSSKHLALASDVMEEFRAICIDAVVLNLCLNGQITPQCGSIRDSTFALDTATIRTFIRAFEERMNASIQHPQTKEPGLDMRAIIDGQIRALIHVCRNGGSAGGAQYEACEFR